MKPYVCFLLTGLCTAFPGIGLGEATNDATTLFGITVTNTETMAEKQFRIGYGLFSGDGVEQDVPKAIECFRQAAELGHAQAQFNLGLCYMNGNGVEQSDQEASKWFKLAAGQGIREAVYPLGICCYNLEEYAEAYAWALVAETDGDSRLKEMLDPMYTNEEIAAGRARYAELKKVAGKKNESSD